MQFMDPKIDLAFKKLFGSEDHKRVTISFLNVMLEYIGDRQIESIHFLNTEQLPMGIEKKENILDIFCVDKKNRKFIIEMQNAWMESFCKRIVYYGAKAYANQLSEAKPYVDLDPVTVVAITKKFIVFPHKLSYKSIQYLTDSKTGEHDFQDLTFAFIELPKFTKKEHELATDEDKWLFLLKEISNYDHIPEPLAQGEFKEACQLLNKISLSDYEQAVYEKNMLDAQAEEANAKAYRKEGERKNSFEIARKMLAQGFDIKTIAGLTELSEAEINTLNS